MLEPESKDVFSTTSNSESESEKIESERQNKTTDTNLDWSTCGNCKTKKGKLTAYVVKKVMLWTGFVTKNKFIAVTCQEFKIICLDKVVLKNVLAGLNETKWHPIENDSLNQSLRYAAYKKFI